MPMTPIPALDRTSATFRADVDTLFLTRIPTFTAEANALEVKIDTAQASQNAAASSASAAAAASEAATYTAGAIQWVSGTTYTKGFNVWSPADLNTYRRKVAGAGTTDPSLDAANWQMLSSMTPLWFKVSDRKAAGTAGGASIAGTQTRTLNTIDLNEVIGATLSANTVSLPAGTYEFAVRAPSFTTGGAQAYLVNTTDSINFYGSSAFSGGSDSVNSDSVVTGKFTITATKSFVVRHATATAVATFGLGAAANQTNEVYTEATFRKVA